MFSHLLFPVDFTGSSVRVVPYVRDLAAKYNARVHVLHVVSDVADLYVPGETVVRFMQDVREAAETMMTDYIRDHFDGVENVYGHVLEGDPAEEILTFARENGEGLIVMGTHGRKGLDRVVFGSVAENVVRSATIPVMTVNPYLVEQA